MQEFKSQFEKKLPEEMWTSIIKEVDENQDGEVKY